MKIAINPARLGKLLAPAAELANHAGTKVPSLTMIHGIPAEGHMVFTGGDGERSVRTRLIASIEGDPVQINLPPGEVMRALAALGEEAATFEVSGPEERVIIKSKTARFSFRQSVVEPPPMDHWNADEVVTVPAKSLQAAVKKVAPVVDKAIPTGGVGRDNCMYIQVRDGKVSCFAASAGLFVLVSFSAVSTEPVNYAVTPRDIALMQGVVDEGNVTICGIKGLVISGERHTARLATPVIGIPDPNPVLQKFDPDGFATFRKIDVEAALSRAAVYGVGNYKKDDRRPILIVFEEGSNTSAAFSTLQYSTGQYTGSVPCEWSGTLKAFNLDQNKLKIALAAIDGEIIEMRWMKDGDRVEIVGREEDGAQAVIWTADVKEVSAE